MGWLQHTGDTGKGMPGLGPHLPLTAQTPKHQHTHLNSSSQSGSCFLAEMARTTSSSKPLGNTSDSIKVLKPYL